MSDWTPIGAEFWDWDPMIQIASEGDAYRAMSARMLWLALYTTGTAKRCVPGLYVGSVQVMAEDARMPADLALLGLDALLEHRLVEFDPKYRLARLCEFPSYREGAVSGKAVKGWWNKFQTIPSCDVRNAHVRTLQAMIEGSATARGVSVNHDAEKVWAETFATVHVPAPRRRGIRRLAESDTSTAVQPSLFPAHAHVVPAVALPTTMLALPSADRSTLCSTVDGSHSAPYEASSADSGFIPLSENRSSIKSGSPNGYPIPTGSGSGTGSDLDLSFPDPDLSSTRRATYETTTSAPSAPVVVLTPTAVPHLMLVPAPEPELTPQSLLGLFPCVTKQWRAMPDLERGRVHVALAALIRNLAASGWGHDDLATAGRWVGVRADDVEVVEMPEVIDKICDASWLDRAIRLGHEHERIKNAKLEALRVAQQTLGYAT